MAVVSALLAAWFWVAPVLAQERVIDVAAWEFPPFAYVDGTGKLRGQAVDTVEKVLTEMGYRPRLVLMPFKRCLAVMFDGLMPMMLPCAVSEERSEYMQFSAPVFYITTVLWKKGSDLTGCWRDYADLAGLKIGVGLGYSYGKAWDEAVASKTFSLAVTPGNSAELTHFRMASEGRIDMFISDLSVGGFIKDRHAPGFDDIYPCPKRIGQDRPFGMPVSRKYFQEHGLSPDAFLDRFNSVLETVAPR